MKVRGSIVACELPIASPLSGAPWSASTWLIAAPGPAEALWTTLVSRGRARQFRAGSGREPVFVDASGNHELAFRKSSKRMSASEMIGGRRRTSGTPQGLYRREHLLGRPPDRNQRRDDSRRRPGDRRENDTVEMPRPTASPKGIASPRYAGLFAETVRIPFSSANLPGVGLLESPFLSRRGLLESVFGAARDPVALR